MTLRPRAPGAGFGDSSSVSAETLKTGFEVVTASESAFHFHPWCHRIMCCSDPVVGVMIRLASVPAPHDGLEVPDVDG